MTIEQHTCITIACNICGETFTDEESGGIPHFDTIPEARDFQDAWDEDYRWTIRDDGYAVCPACDEKHDAARAALAPKPPTAQVPGQQELPAEVDAERLPHEDYMQAVFDALDHFGLHPKDVTTTTPDGQQLDGVISFPAAEFPDRWPDGVYLGWDQRGGWSLCDEGTDRNLWDLDLDTYANPAAVADRARTRLLDLPDTTPDETWDGALDLRDAVAVWESGDAADADAPSCRDCGTWPCARHATDTDRAEYAQATESGSAR